MPKGIFDCRHYILECEYKQFTASGGTKIEITPIANPQECFSKCLEKKRNGNVNINGVSVDDIFQPTKCYCHENQNEVQISSNSWNCKMSNEAYLKGLFHCRLF